jgi:beta-phosphoglucomutase-like phosphatase (HAD superfamily)
VIHTQPTNSTDIEGAIFDCDGTLIDSMRMWLPCWYHACEKFDLTMTEEMFWNLIGTPIHDIVIAIYESRHGEKPSEKFIETFLAEKRKFHESHELEAGSPSAIECVVKLVHEYKAKGIKVAIASSGLREMVER